MRTSHEISQALHVKIGWKVFKRILFHFLAQMKEDSLQKSFQKNLRNKISIALNI
jgi:hypothetical protein